MRQSPQRARAALGHRGGQCLLLHPQGPPAWLQKAVGSGNEMWALCISLCLQKDPLAQGHWAARVGNLWKPEVGRQSPITVRRWLLIFRPAGRPLRALFPRKPGSLDSTERAGSGAGRKVLCQGTQRQTLSLFPGRCCPLLVKSQPVPLCWSVLPKLLTVLGKRARSYLRHPPRVAVRLKLREATGMA